MSRIRANKITNQLADGSPTVENGLIISGITTSTTFSGSGASLTNLPAAQLSGTAAAINGSNITNLNASNIASGTVPTARLGSGTASSSTFLRGDSTFQTVVTDLVADTSPQLGGLLESNGSNIKMADSDIIVVGTGNDLQISHTSNISRLRGATTNDIHIESAANFKVRHQDTDGSNAEDMLICTGDGAVELYFNNSKKIESTNTGAVVTGILTATSFSGSGANLTSLRANRNLIINGDCSVCQYRGITGETTGVGVLTTDRWYLGYSGHDEEITQEHRNNPVSDAPSKLGISHSFQVKNGNQTSTGSSDYCRIVYTIESQYMRNSGWDFQNPNSYITLSFWCKSSVSKNFYGMVFCQDSPFKQRSFETGTLTANTWTKVEISIPGTSGMNFDHDTGPGFIIYWYLYSPTSYTSGNGPLNTWMGYNSTKFTPTDSDAWWTADNATFDITGVQLEVGNVATPFELKNYEQNLWECKRYYQRSTDQNRGSNYSLETSSWHSADGVQSFSKHGSYYDFKQNFEREMRVAPTLTIYGSTNQGDIHLESVAVGSKQVDWNNNTTEVQTKGFLLRHIEDQSDGNYTSGSGNAFGILAYTLDAEF